MGSKVEEGGKVEVGGSDGQGFGPVSSKFQLKFLNAHLNPYYFHSY